MTASLGAEVFSVILIAYRQGRRQGRRRVGADFVAALMAKLRTSDTAGFPAELVDELRLPVKKAGWPSDDGPARQTGWVCPEWFRVEVEALLREVIWRGDQYRRRRNRQLACGRHGPPITWDDSIRSALCLSLVEAESAAVTYVSAAHLLLGLLTEPSGVVAALLRRGGGDPDAIAERMWARASAGGRPCAPLTSTLEGFGTVVSRVPWLVRWVPGFLRGQIKARYRFGPLMFWLHDEIARQCVRAGSETVMTAHAVLAVLSFREQLIATGGTLAEAIAPVSSVGEILDRHGVTLGGSVMNLANLPGEPETLSRVEADERVPVTGGLLWSRRTVEAMERAITLAGEYRHPEVGTNHLVLAVLSDPHSSGFDLVRKAGADPLAIRTELERTLATGLQR